MILTKLHLVNFRNYRKVLVKFDPHLNIFIGNNAQGKTNILESIYVLAITKSHRFGIENHLIRQGEEKAQIQGTIKVGKISKDLEVDIYKQKKQVKINKTEIRRIAEYITHMNVIMFCPDDLDIIKGSPQNRRNLLNIEISQIFKDYIQYQNEYNKILKTRNEYLKMMSVNRFTDERYLDILTDKLIERAIIIYQFRKKFLDLVGAKIGDIYENIMGEPGLILSYYNNLDLHDYSMEEIRSHMLFKLKDNFRRELQQGSTLYGPHRDDFIFLYQGNDIKLYGSQGQQRVAIISFKLAEISIFKEQCETSPILLLDDIFSELDLKKRTRLIEYLQDDIQTIITTTDVKNINKKIIEKAKIFTVHAGNITEKVGK